MNIRVYVEGGGTTDKTRTKCRRGFATLLNSAKLRPGSLKIVACGDRHSTYRDFRTAVRTHSSDMVLLLVDSEEAVTENLCWSHLQEQDNWQCPKHANEDNAYMMVRCMESWLLADRNALANYYGQGFLEKRLPGNTEDIEMIKKEDALRGLEEASKGTQKGRYHKTNHAFEILATIDWQKVSGASKQAKRLFDLLRQKPR